MSSTKPLITVTLKFDPDEMARRGRIGAYARLSKYDSADLTAPARAAFLDKFEQAVDPDGILPPQERQRRATYARKAHFIRLARLSAAARSKKPRASPTTAPELSDEDAA